MVPFSMTFNDPWPKFQGHAIIWLYEKRYETNRDLHMPYSTVSFRMTLSDLNDLAKGMNMKRNYITFHSAATNHSELTRVAGKRRCLLMAEDDIIDIIIIISSSSSSIFIIFNTLR